MKGLLLLIALLTPFAARSADVRDLLQKGETARVAEVVDGDTVVLDRAVEESTQVRLVGLQAPKLPLGRKGFKPWPLAPESKAALEALVLNEQVTLYYGGSRRDRHGRRLAHLLRDDGIWVQGVMLGKGMARVYTFADNRAVTAQMFVAEALARDARRGIWAHPFYGVRSTRAAPLMRRVGSFQVIAGPVVQAAKVKGRIYLNFGDDWRTDFTVVLDRKALRLFKQAGTDPLGWQGRRVRVRGWLRKYNGPLIDATHPEQIEMLER